MSDTKNNGGPAFPVEGMWSEDGKFLRGIQTGSTPLTGWHEGMTLRDYFAAKAMQGMVSAGCTIDIDKEVPFLTRATTAYAIADALLKAREQ